MMDILVGCTGFVGSNLAASHSFAGQYNSRNIEAAFGTKPELLVYAGIRAEKYLANQNPEADMAVIENAIDNIKKINPRQIVLISTVDVYRQPVQVNEATAIDTANLQPYGLHRYYLEQWVEQNVEQHLIVRLPGLYGKNIKKNFVFDLITIIPFMLNQAKFDELSAKEQWLGDYFQKQDNGFYQCRKLTSQERQELKQYFKESGFSALNFTDSRGIFQFYPLAYLWQHIQLACRHHIRKLNLATEPVSIAELYHHIEGRTFDNPIATIIPEYNFQSNFAGLFGGTNGYIFTKEFIKQDIKKFVEAQR